MIAISLLLSLAAGVAVMLPTLALRQYVYWGLKEHRLRLQMLSRDLKDLDKRLAKLESSIEPTDIDDEPEGGIEYEDIHPAIKEKVREVLVARGFTQNGSEAHE